MRFALPSESQDQVRQWATLHSNLKGEIVAISSVDFVYSPLKSLQVPFQGPGLQTKRLKGKNIKAKKPPFPLDFVEMAFPVWGQNASSFFSIFFAVIFFVQTDLRTIYVWLSFCQRHALH